MAKQDEYARYTIRVPKALYAALEDAATKANRSVNAEIVEQLDHALQNPKAALAEKDGDLAQYRENLTSAEQALTELKQQYENIRMIVDTNFQTQRNHMYLILNYIDEIPPALSIWAFNMLTILDGADSFYQLQKKYDSYRFTEQDKINLIKDHRDRHYEEAIDKIKSALEKGDE